MPDNIVIPFPDDPADWPQSYVNFQISQIQLASPSLVDAVVVPDNPTLQAAVPTAFSTAGNQTPGSARTVW